MGTPEFAIPSLEAVNGNHEIVGVISQPDRPRGRGNVVVPSPLKKRAIELDLPVYTFEKIGVEGVETLRSLRPDIMVTAAYGQILTDEILSIAPHGIINVHGSILPSWRGSSPVQHAVLFGDKITGVTIMKTARAVDSGDIVRIATLEIGEDGTDRVLERLSHLGAEELIKALSDIERGVATFTPQDHASATFCKMLTKQDAIIDWNEPAEQVCRKIRAFDYMGASTTIKANLVKIYSARVANGSGEIGEIITASEKTGIEVACKNGSVILGQMLLAGGKRMNSSDVVRGRKIAQGEVFGS